MNSLLIYFLEVSICFALFYSVYIIFKGDTFYYLKRIYLVFTVLISLIIPQISSPNLPVNIEQIIIVEPTQDLSNVIFQDTFEKVVFGLVPENILVSKGNIFLSLFNLLGIIYILGLLYFLYRFLRSLFHIYHLYKHNNKDKYLNYRLIHLPTEYPTFSFFNCIFLNKSNLSDEEKDNVILHEIVHIKQKHSIDILFVEICRILFWFNPIIWLYKSSLIKVHECLADRYFIEKKPENIIDYQSLLLKQYLSNIHIELAHSFNYSLIKYRIKMMTKSKSKWWAKYKLVFALPIIVIGLVAFSNADINLANSIGNNEKDAETQPEGMVFIPQGSFVMKRNDGQSIQKSNVSIEAFWMKETEVTVKEYFDYLKSIENKVSKEEYQLLLPDFDKAPNENYFTSEKYMYYPVVGVNYKQAELFCVWKTFDENERRRNQGKEPIHEYRIPIESEWIYASFGGLQPEDITQPETSLLTKVGKGKPNNWGIYNIFDNVSEWNTNDYVSNLDSSYHATKYKTIHPACEQSMQAVNSLGNGWVNATTYLKEDVNPSKKVVRGGNYKSLETIRGLDNHQSYDYVGFRYVRSYKGNQN